MTTHLRRYISLRTAVGMAAGTVAVFFAGVYAAHAGPGVAGLSPRTYFTISGRLTGVTSPMPGLTFVFHKGAATCAPPTSSESYDPATSGYSAQVDYSTGVGCSAAFFDGGDITVEVFAGATRVVPSQPINPVPYAQFAAVAGFSTNAAMANGISPGAGARVAYESACLAVGGTAAARQGRFITVGSVGASCGTICANAAPSPRGHLCVMGWTESSLDGAHFEYGDECAVTGSHGGVGVVCCCQTDSGVNLLVTPP